MEKIKERLGGLTAGILLSAAASFLLCIYAPFELYLSNQTEFWFDAATIALPSVLLFLCLTAAGCVLFFLLRLCGNIPYDIGLAVGGALLLYLYIQGNFLVSGLPPLDGADFDWSSPSPERIKSVLVLLLAAAVSVLFLIFLKRRFYRKILTFAPLFLLLMLALTLTTLFLRWNIVDKRGNLTCYNTEEFTLSEKNDNLVVLVLDAVDERTFRQVLDAHPEYEHLFDDFTLYDNALAAYPYSMMSIPMILSGQWYENGESFASHVSKALDASPLIKALEKKHYRMGIYDEGDLLLDAKRHEGRYENQIALRDGVTSVGDVFRLLFKMAGLKFAPWDLKKDSYDMVEYAQSIRVSAVDDMTPYSWSNRVFYEKITASQDPFTRSDASCFRFIHLDGAHVPYKYDENVNIISSGGTYQKNIEASLTLCEAFLSRLRSSGLYDNSAVVILADHGYDGADDRQKIAERMHPMLLVKGIGESHPMAVSDAPVSYTELADAFAALTDGKSSRDIFPEADGETRERRMLLYYYLHEDKLLEYTTKGLPFEVEKMVPTGTTYTLADN